MLPAENPRAYDSTNCKMDQTTLTPLAPLQFSLAFYYGTLVLYRSIFYLK